MRTAFPSLISTRGFLLAAVSRRRIGAIAIRYGRGPYPIVVRFLIFLANGALLGRSASDRMLSRRTRELEVLTILLENL